MYNNVAPFFNFFFFFFFAYFVSFRWKHFLSHFIPDIEVNCKVEFFVESWDVFSAMGQL
jgi:hypothetical protein